MFLLLCVIGLRQWNQDIACERENQFKNCARRVGYVTPGLGIDVDEWVHEMRDE